jgi:hypothetical protein
MSINFSLENLKRVYVSSCRRGFLAVSDQPMCVTEASGGSGNSTIIAVKRVYREGGKWVYEKPDLPGQWWLKSAWKEAVALTGGQPWRVYELDAAEVAERLDSGEFADDIRGFKNRCEPWQPIRVDENGDTAGPAESSSATVWERMDGWRVVADGNGRWVPDGSKCDACRSILKESPNHFDPIPDFTTGILEEAFATVDANRPWA